MTGSCARILVIRGGAIGDFILTLPAIAALRSRFPHAHLEVLGYPHIVQLAVAGGLVDRARSIEAGALAGFFARDGELAADLADYFSEFDLIVSYLYDPDEIFRANVSRCTLAQFLPGPHRPNEAAGLHATAVYLKPLERLAIFDADSVPRLRVGDARTPQTTQDEQTAPRTPSLDNGDKPDACPALALHPGSGSDRKNWPEPKWAELLGHLTRSTEFGLLLIGGEAEGGRLHRLAAPLPPARLRVALSLPLPQLAALLQQCAAFIGHDSGISHLAAALGLPGLVLWGDSVEAVWRPPSDKVALVRWPAGLADLPVTEVLEQLRLMVYRPVE